MIKAVRYQNFKRYEDVSLDLSKNLTVLVGPNSSGKSSLIKGLLAFKQTFDDQSDHAGFVSKGDYVDIGHFDEYVRNHDSKERVSFVFDLDISKLSMNRQILKDLHDVDNVFIKLTHELDPQTKHGRVFSYEIYVPNSPDNISIDNFLDCKSFIIFERMQKHEESFKLNCSEEMYGRLPLFGSTRMPYEKFNAACSSGRIQAKRDNQRGMTFDLVNKSDFQAVLAPLMYFWINDIHRSFYDSFTKSLFALGPLRERASRTVSRTDERQKVGSQGQNATSVYLDMRQRAVKAGKKEARARATFGRLVDWLRRLNLSHEVEINSWRDLVDMRTRNNATQEVGDSIVDVGVGFSQASPILIQLAAMPDEATLIIEQPELHLYPWSQTRIGEILCEEAFRGKKNIIIETHSEHVIHGIQLAISQNRISGTGLKNNDVQIIYIDEKSNINKLNINEFGEFTSDWPEGFFDQTLQVYKTIIANRNK